MSVVKRGNSKYWYIQFQVHGRTYIKSARTTNKKAAEQMEIDWRAKLHAQNYLGHRPSITLSEALKEYSASRTGTAFYKAIVSHCKTVEASLASTRKLSELTSEDLERFKRARVAHGSAPQTIKHYLNVIRGTIKHARKLGYAVPELVYPEVEAGKMPLRYLSDDEERRLLTALDPRREGRGLATWNDRDEETRRNMQDAYDLVILLLDTGARYSEIANIEWRRIDLVSRTIHLWRPKVQNEAILYMTHRVYDILRRRHEDGGVHVFTNRQGNARGYAAQAIRKAFRNAGLADCRIHTLRHTHASRLVQNGMSVYEVREVLGHTDIKTTMRYAHLESRQVTSRARDVINRINAGARVDPFHTT